MKPVEICFYIAHNLNEYFENWIITNITELSWTSYKTTYCNTVQKYLDFAKQRVVLKSVLKSASRFFWRRASSTILNSTLRTTKYTLVSLFNTKLCTIERYL